jgi:hypothetical protein
MQRRALSVIDRFHIYALFLEEVQGYRLISLCSNVNNADSELVSLVDICPVLDEHFNQFDVSSERCKMNGGKAVIGSLCIQPLFDDDGCDLFECTVHNSLANLL